MTPKKNSEFREVKFRDIQRGFNKKLASQPLIVIGAYGKIAGFWIPAHAAEDQNSAIEACRDNGTSHWASEHEKPAKTERKGASLQGGCTACQSEEAKYQDKETKRRFCKVCHWSMPGKMRRVEIDNA